MQVLNICNLYIFKHLCFVEKTDKQGAEGEVAMETDAAEPQPPAAGEEGATGETTAAPKKLRLSYENYKKLANMLVLHMRRAEEIAEGYSIYIILHSLIFMITVWLLKYYEICFLCAADDDMGTRRTELVNWYLNEVESEIESEQELMERKTLVEKVIYRLVHHVSSYLWSRDQTRGSLVFSSSLF